MNDEQKYLFDLHGYLVLGQVVPLAVMEGCHKALGRFENMDPEILRLK